MDPYVPILKKCPQQILRPTPREPLTDHCLAKASIKSLVKHQSKTQHITLCHTKSPLQTPYTAFTLHGAQSS
jgi:hypothetical protein